MEDALKLAEEALEKLLPWALQAGANAEDALSSIRAARAELGWKLLSDLSTASAGLVTVGRWLDGKWVTKELNCYADIIVGLGYTHYAIPQLPPPPAREEVGNG